MKRTALILMILVLIAGLCPAFALAVGSDSMEVSFRIEGKSENLYTNSGLAFDYTDTATLADAVAGCLNAPNAPSVTIDGSGEEARVTAVDELAEGSVGGLFNDTWMFRVNGEPADARLQNTSVQDGDEIVLYYGDPELMQYPEMDLSRMIPDGVVRFTSDDAVKNDAGQTYVATNPVVGAIVTWDGMTYKTDASGEIIIDSTGAGVSHTVQIERSYENGLPTVLRFAPGYSLTYGFSDVMPEAWYYDAVMFASDLKLVNGVTQSDFGPDAAMNRAMFVTVLGRLTGVEVDQTQGTNYPDVVNDGWSVGYIQWASDKGIVTGYSDGTFGQYREITREQLAVMLYRYEQHEGFETGLLGQDLSSYPDLGGVSPYAEAAVRWAVERGLITGSDGRLDPSGLATRAQVATMIQRFVLTFHEING
jgi:hypothetical protein